MYCVLLSTGFLFKGDIKKKRPEKNINMFICRFTTVFWWILCNHSTVLLRNRAPPCTAKLVRFSSVKSMKRQARDIFDAFLSGIPHPPVVLILLCPGARVNPSGKATSSAAAARQASRVQTAALWSPSCHHNLPHNPSVLWGRAATSTSLMDTALCFRSSTPTTWWRWTTSACRWSRVHSLLSSALFFVGSSV